ncbi:Uncharacterized protein Rs2_05293 [Raphanus sativus]|nr:Uncharacterized protein Rs2_05293 [Raphanus sativus]
MNKLMEIEETTIDKSQYKDGKKGRFQNNKIRHGGKDRFSKKPKFQDNNSYGESCTTTRQPILLEKLLTAGIKRDKSLVTTNEFILERVARATSEVASGYGRRYWL